MSFDELKSLTHEWETKLSSFLEENSHLSSAISQAIDEVVSNSVTKRVDIDLQAAEQTRIDFETKVDQSMQENWIRDKERKRNLFLSLEEQVKLVNERKELKQYEERIEQEKIDAFIATKECEKLQRDKSFGLKLKHVRFAPENTNPSHSPQPVSSNQTPTRPVAVTDDLITFESPQRPRNNNSSQICELMNEDDIPVFIEREKRSANEAKRSYVKKKQKEKTIMELMTHKYDNNSNLDSIVLEEGEEKFNPNKIIVRKPPPYQVNIDFSEFFLQL